MFMGGLQKLVEVELRLTVDLLKKNYDEPDEATWQECRDLTMKYILLSTSVSHKGFVFVKCLTKVGHRIWEEGDAQRRLTDKFSNVYLGNLYKFNLEGVNMVQHSLLHVTDEPLRKALEVMQIHFLGYAADAAREKFSLTEKPMWAARWVRKAKMSAALSQEMDPVYSSYRLFSAAEAAVHLYHQRRNNICY